MHVRRQWTKRIVVKPCGQLQPAGAIHLNALVASKVHVTSAHENFKPRC